MKYIFFLIGLLVPVLFLPALSSAESWSTLQISNGNYGWTTCGLEQPFNTTPKTSVPKTLGAISEPYQSTDTGTITRACRDGSGNNQGAASVGAGIVGYWYRISYLGGNVVVERSSDYVPPPVEPLTCSDGVQASPETGIDCGDPACIGDEVCTTYCPVGFNAETRTSSDGFTSTGCYSSDASEYTIDAKLGICPNGLFKSLTDTNKCVEYYAPTMASNDYLDPPPVPVATADPWNVFTQDNTVGISSTVETVDGVTTETVTTTETGTDTAGDSSEKITDVTTVTAADGTKTVTTNITTNKTYSGGTAVAGETTTTTQTYDAAGNLTGSTSSGSTSESEPGLTDSFSAPGSPDGTGDVVDGALLDVFLDRWVSFSDSVSAAPVFTPLTTIFNGPDTTLKTPAFVLPMGSYGDKSFLLSDYDDTFDALGLLFIFLAVWSAARTVMGNGMSKNHV